MRLSKNIRVSRFYFPCILAFLALAVVVRGYDPFAVQALRLIAFDTYQRLAPRAYDPDLPVRIVDIDEESLKRIGQWPWPRTTIRDLLVKLNEHNAAAIAFDVMFAEPDQHSIEQIVRQLPPAQASALSQAAAGTATNDEALADALKAAPSIVAITLTGGGSATPPPPKAGFAIAGDDPKPLLHEFTGADRNLPAIEAAAQGIGSINWLPSRDQVLRRVPLFYRLGDTIIPSLSAEALRIAQGASTYVLKASGASQQTGFGAMTGLNNVKIGGIEIPVEGDGAITLRFRDSNRAAYLPAWKVLNGEIGDDAIAGRIIFVGTSAPGLLDLRATPLDTALPGVEVHAQTVEHVLSQQHLTRPDYALGVEQVIIVVLGLILAFVMLRLSPAMSAALGALMFITLNLDGWFAFQNWELLFDPLYPSLILLLLTVGITFYIYRQTEAQRGQIRTAFGRYLAPAVVEDIVANPGNLELGGEVRELTLMFCDVRNFTSISEGLSAHELTNFINELLTPMTDIILNHRGTIDKYMGDAIMAFWNAPLAVGDHAERACRAAIEMAGKMADLNERWQAAAQAAGRPFNRVRIGIGINTGDCCVGNLGSEQRFDYSAIGDEVNVTSRLEGLTKIYGLPAVISDHTKEKCPSLPVLELDYIQVKGRKRATRIYTLFDILRGEPDAIARLRGLHEEFLVAYRAKKWDDADNMLARCRELKCTTLEAYYTMFRERIAELRQTTLPADWDGSYAMTEK